ncbi:MAG: nicotinate phosphoribosyltransferase [Gammaproteobacteria bacterium]|nr:nicotinate phosphoribosyltransferase [Gammaproteobacteria bacterium]
MIDATHGALLTDLYQLTMLQAYWRHGMEQTAVFEFFVRKLPAQRGFLVAAGLEQTLQYLEGLHFTSGDLAWLANTGKFESSFLDYLGELRFRGSVHAMAEGTPFFADEPIVRVTAPLPQAQLVESRVINLLHFQSLIASKAARCVLMAPDKPLVEFGLRRAHGAEAGLLAARASYLAGFVGTATVAAGAMFDIPTYGTMAHSFIQAHDDETSAFRDFAVTNPGSVVLLIDTYDTEAAAAKVAALAPSLREEGIMVKGVRIDSGDLGQHARRVRSILDAAGLQDVTIFASGNIDEYLLNQHAEQQIPIDSYGIGTHLDTSADASYLDCAYKLQEYAGTARRKRSEGKATWPGRKQVYRRENAVGIMINDVVALEDDVREGSPLLREVMRDGRRLEPPMPLSEIRDYTLEQLGTLPPSQRRLRPDAPYPVTIAESVKRLATKAVSTMPR